MFSTLLHYINPLYSVCISSNINISYSNTSFSLGCSPRYGRVKESYRKPHQPTPPFVSCRTDTHTHLYVTGWRETPRDGLKVAYMSGALMKGTGPNVLRTVLQSKFIAR